jgi:hypothetical protein
MGLGAGRSSRLPSLGDYPGVISAAVVGNILCRPFRISVIWLLAEFAVIKRQRDRKSLRPVI